MTQLFPELQRSYEPILISLRKQWMDRIAIGEKRHEFRRIFLREPACAFVYVVAPDAVVSHVIWLGAPIVASPEEVAAIGEQERPGGGQSLLEYFRGRSECFAAPIQAVQPIVPIALEQIRIQTGGFMPPQSYLRLRRHRALLELLMAHAVRVVDAASFAPMSD